MSRTLLDYLTERNPDVNNDNSLKGAPTYQEHLSKIELQDWPDFTIETLMACYGHVLERDFDATFPEISPPISLLERMIFNEDSLDHLLSRSIVPAVSVGLQVAWDLCYPGHEEEVIDITRGGRAILRANARNDAENAIFPDWAGVQKIENPNGFANRCPGDTKLSTKWSSKKKDAPSYKWPFAQVLKYAGDNWKTRYGYLISQKELVVLRFSREIVGSGVALKRSPRVTRPPSAQPPAQSARQHPRQRNDSIASYMSLDRASRSPGPAPRSPGGESYVDDQLDIEYCPVEMKSIPWRNYGRGKLTVKLALWWIHMLAAAPGGEIYIGHDYPPLNSWVPVDGRYRHTSTGLVSKKYPKHGMVLDPEASQGPSTPPRDPSTPSRGQRGVASPFSSPLSSPPMVADMMPTLEELMDVRWDENNDRWWFETSSGRRGHFAYSAMIWSQREECFGHAEEDQMGNFVFVARH
ncbi:uncharacterized protein GIQ15_04064 [Arthroderma uncinatum]|uniref:uncharacterized protein n=1 Tax=Arthroderma uncinatum TaxID=74035 RepID=UPI00144AE66E|nr:uncharacterized protein GIQ15_04064 [Arthroderma uncinatum]KAF3481305.1 hypothetical protein GIQ15_04064 [Arthroderma uncinatum]